MNKQEFIEFLNAKAEERSNLSHWRKEFSNSDDFWNLFLPGVDWLPDSIDLREDGVVEIVFCDGSEANITYDEFSENYNKYLR